jgi:penicillin-binding protein 2
MNRGNTRTTRVLVLTIVIFSILGLYAFKLFSMQILHGDKYRQQSQNISQRAKKLTAQRGEIFDRNGNVPMVLNIDSFAVDVSPGEIPSAQFATVISRLADVLGVSQASIEKKIPTQIRRSFQPIEIKANVPYNTITEIAETIDELPGVSWRSKPIRNYVETGSISHVLGYVGDITREELKIFYNKGYAPNSTIGKAGIEKQYDELLRGVDGYEYKTVDVKGRYIENSTSIKAPEMGKNLILTIDRKTQILAEEALGKRIGSAVVLKPSTGEVLAMVSYPYYDPNLFNNDNSNEEYQRLLADKDNPLLNRVVNASYPPASTFKVIMTTALLQENAISPDKRIVCEGEISYGDRTFRCWIHKPGHGPLDLKNALAQSCDVYFWVAGRDNLGVERISSYSSQFGFGQSAQIDLPSQTDGFVPTPQWKERRFHEKWLGGDTMNMSIGQGYLLVSPLQLADMVAMVVNSGTVYKPHLLKEVRDPVTNAVISTTERQTLLQSTVSPETFAKVREDMRYMITNGTAVIPMKNKVVQLAGKTGTAEVGRTDGHWHSWMVAYGPYDGPPEDAVVVVVMVEAVNQWEWWAPYAANIIMQGIFADQTYDESVSALGFKYLTSPRGRQE